MFGTRGENIPTDVCAHAAVVNTREDERVCTDCGLVLEEQLYYDFFHPKGWATPNGGILLYGENRIHKFIRDIGANACIPDNVVLYATNYYEKIQAALPLKIKPWAIAAYALYESLNKFEVPRMAEEIAHYSGVKLQDIWQVETHLMLEETLSDPKLYVQSYCNLLQFSYADQVCVRETVELVLQLPLGNIRCNCLVAVVLYLHCKDSKKKITLRKICEVCKISATSVHRVIRHLQELTLEISKTSLVWMTRHIKKLV